MHILPNSSSIKFSLSSSNSLSYDPEMPIDGQAPISVESCKTFRQVPLELFQTRVTHFRTIVSDEELSYFIQDGTNICLGAFDPSLHATREYELFMSQMDRRIGCLGNHINDLTENSLHIRNFSLVGLALTAPLAVAAFVIRAVALKALALSLATLSLALLLTSYVQLYLKYRAELDLESLNLKVQNYQLIEAAAFDNQQKRITQKIFDSIFDFEGYSKNEQFALEFDQLQDEGTIKGQFDIYLINGKKTVLC